MIIHAILLHEEGDDEGGTSGHPHLAVNEDIMIGEHGLDVGVSLIEVRIYAHFLIIFEIDPLAMLYLISLDLVLHAKGVVCTLVYYAQHAVYLQFLH
jgi:hypothetical protein